MKYPQLVSPRAVSAISDWLVSRLEQLGVESPQIYTRLLLSLLQSSVQINDPIEFSNLEAFFANRKGGHKRFHLPSDTETLKKLNAVHCLREIVSNEQETSTIEKLVDELCEKLKDIEKQTHNLSDEERFLIETQLITDSLLQTHTQLHHQQEATSSNNNNVHHHTRLHHQYDQYHQHQVTPYICTNPKATTRNIDAKRNVIQTIQASSSTLNDLDNDPKKRYFRAFPALSKEMEDSFRTWRRNAKSLTWPVIGRSVVIDNLNNSSASSCSSTSSIISSSNVPSCVLRDKGVEKKLNELVAHHLESNIIGDRSGSGCSANISYSEEKKYEGLATERGKKKSRRRRNQGKTTQNIRKLSGGTSGSVGVNKYHNYTQRKSSPVWDTDFKGCWEMGPDLIEEFLNRQNGNKRDLSASDTMDQEERNDKHKITNDDPATNNKNVLIKTYIDLSFCYDNSYGNENKNLHFEELVDYVDEDYNDHTLAAVSKLGIDSNNPKRLYQREGLNQSSFAVGSTVFSENIGDNYVDETVDSVDSLDFQHFKAKFNSSVEALWRDIEPSTTVNCKYSVKPQTADNSLNVHNRFDGEISSSFDATTSLHAIAPFKKDLLNFWSNYQQPITSTSSMITTTTRIDNRNASSGIGGDVANSSDYFSMPSNLDDFDKPVGNINRGNEATVSLGTHTPSINVFLRNSIWSTSGDCVDSLSTSSVSTTIDTDKSFLFKVWHSNKKLSELEVGNADNGDKTYTTENDPDGVRNLGFNKSKVASSLMVNNPNLGANMQFPSYQNLKWSEGINASPSCSTIRIRDSISHNNELQTINNSFLRDENSFPSFSSVVSLSSATWKAPIYGQQAQPDLKSWCASNPMSLTEMYGKDVYDSIINEALVKKNEKNQTEIYMGPAVTLPNHSANTSGFVPYNRIKQCGIIQPAIKPVKNANIVRLAKEFLKSNEDENLLTSERTHFHPIENFVDGHTFEISNSLDNIKFERTSSGLLSYESKEYLEYTRNDIYIAEEEVATNSTNFLNNGTNTTDDKSGKFSIKFRVKRSGEIASQTEDQDFQLAAEKRSATLGRPPSSMDVSHMFNNTFSLNSQTNNEDIMAAVTKAVAAAAKATGERDINAGHFYWLPSTNKNNTTVEENYNDNNSLWRLEKTLCDEVDFCKVSENRVKEPNEQLAQNWSMQEVEKQHQQRLCLLQHEQQQEHKREYPTISDIEIIEDSSLDNSSLHTLWGMCAMCNSCEYSKSMPANSLLRDELQLEADEIMSDLRYMQDLYISESNILDSIEAQAIAENGQYTDNRLSICVNKNIKNPWSVDIKNNEIEQSDSVQVSMLQKVNQLIEDLLKPENANSPPREKPPDNMIYTTELRRSWSSQAQQPKTKSVWEFVEQKDNNIWQHKPAVELIDGKQFQHSKTFAKPMKLLKEVGNSLDEDKNYIETLNWEHDNLAKIWQQYLPRSFQLNEETSMAKNISNERLSKTLEVASSGGQIVMEENNIKNASTSLSPLPLCNTYQKMQQFLSNSTSKMKLVSNRKRRHSASQNFYQQLHLQCNNSSSNNNNDLNARTQQYNTLKTFNNHQHSQKSILSNDITLTNDINTEEQPIKQTIITCKYWTTATNGTQSSLDSAAAAMMLLAAATTANNPNNMLTTGRNYHCDQDLTPDETFGNTFSYLIDKNASILKHMTMTTRPLTR